jgi:RNA polymerase sigma-70 factor (sigma-E family)
MRTGVETVRVQGGVLADLYVRHAPDALRLAYLLTGDRTLAEDLVQDAFVRLAGRLLHVPAGGDLHAYLRTTIVNLVRSHGRRRAVERRYLERQSAPHPFESADFGEREAMRHALMGLPVRQRTAIVLRYYEDLSETATASAMRCSGGTVRSLVARGRATLRTKVGEI